MNGIMTIQRRGIFTWIVLLSLISSVALADRAQWKREEVDWQAGRGRRIKAVHHPRDKDLPRERAEVRTGKQKRSGPKATRAVKPLSTAQLDATSQATSPVLAYDIEVDSPPVDGFVPWIAVSVTKKNAGDLNFEAVPRPYVVGSYPSGVDPDKDYIIGLYDTGASAHVMGYAAARQSGLYSNGWITST